MSLLLFLPKIEIDDERLFENMSPLIHERFDEFGLQPEITLNFIFMESLRRICLGLL